MNALDWLFVRPGLVIGIGALVALGSMYLALATGEFDDGERAVWLWLIQVLALIALFHIAYTLLLPLLAFYAAVAGSRPRVAALHRRDERRRLALHSGDEAAGGAEVGAEDS